MSKMYDVRFEVFYNRKTEVVWQAVEGENKAHAVAIATQLMLSSFEEPVIIEKVEVEAWQ